MRVSRFLLILVFVLQAFFVYPQNTFPPNDNVGIGTMNPQSKLHIEGGHEPRAVQTLFPATYISGTPVSGLRLSWYNDSWDIRAHRSQGYPIDAFSIARNGSEYFRISDDGNLGIGTSAPRFKLDVIGQALINGGLRLSADASNGEVVGTAGRGLSFYTNDGVSNPLVLTTDGKVGIGTPNPGTALQIGDFNNGGATNQLLIPGTYNFEQLRLGQVGNGNQALEFINHMNINTSYGIKLLVNVDQTSGLQLQYSSPKTDYNSLEYTTGFYMNLLGNIGIGTLQPTERLSVKGKIRAQEIKVEGPSVDWPDYVFEPSYQRASLADVEKYIKVNRHLPEIPSAKEVKENGISLGEMNAKLLKKIEELTLYLIEQNKKNEVQSEELLKAKIKIEELTTKVDGISQK